MIVIPSWFGPTGHSMIMMNLDYFRHPKTLFKFMFTTNKKPEWEKNTYMFNNTQSNIEILVNKLKWKVLSISWNDNRVHVSCSPSHLLDITSLLHLSDITSLWLLNCWTKTCSHVRYPMCPTAMVINILIASCY